MQISAISDWILDLKVKLQDPFRLDNHCQQDAVALQSGSRLVKSSRYSMT